MKIVETITLISKGNFPKQPDWLKAREELHEAITRIEYPEGTKKFTIHPVKDGNGVADIKKKFFSDLQELGWITRNRASHDNVDGILITTHGAVAMEWETGHIASSHRSMNKMCRGLMTGKFIGGTLIVPSDDFARYLTDRVSNIRELRDYVDFWQLVESRIKQG